MELEGACEHIRHVQHLTHPKRLACEDCLKIGGEWVHLRECLACGHVGCCDDSPNRHATAHFRATKHPIISSAEPGETWCWCYIDERMLG